MIQDAHGNICGVNGLEGPVPCQPFSPESRTPDETQSQLVANIKLMSIILDARGGVGAPDEMGAPIGHSGWPTPGKPTPIPTIWGRVEVEVAVKLVDPLVVSV
ncbi:hypothetical protein FBZ90_103418 [Nitrospirillum pindoramense]|uniref:Uncharacterized protein n=1 Tax=Nitrospirillum amazonense TaxID=28077 RepID=A0A560HGS0_9PROT|nr:hypothetical protein FBZ90_103418 [Nitrospirillum amazonense]